MRGEEGSRCGRSGGPEGEGRGLLPLLLVAAALAAGLLSCALQWLCSVCSSSAALALSFFAHRRM